MAVRRRGGAVKGAIRVRKLLARLPEDIRQEMIVELNLLGPKVLQRARSQSGFRDRSGKLRAALDWRVYPKNLRLRVGILKRNRDLFYGHILEVGRRAKTVIRTSSAGLRHPYTVSPISPAKYDIIGGRVKAWTRAEAKRALSVIYERGLRRASRGAGNE